MTDFIMHVALQQPSAAEPVAAQAAAARAEAQVEVERALREAQQEIQRAQRDAQEAQREAQREAQQAVRDAQREARDAIREAQTVQPPPWARDFPTGAPEVPEGAVVISLAFFAMCAIIAIGIPIARAFARRMDKRAASPGVDADTRMRLERIEHAVDAIALEVERISEGQRFTSKVLANIRALPEPDPADALAAPLGRARERR